MKKKSFTLLEVMIAIALVSLCAPLLFSTPFRIAKKEICSIFANEVERLADKESYALKIDLLSHGSLWHEIVKEESVPRLLEQKEVTIAFSPKQKRRYTMKKELVSSKSKPEAQLFEVKISLKTDSKKKENHSFSYFFAVPI